MSDLERKKLLLLGGTQQTCDAVKAAQAMGVTVLVTDYYPDSSRSPARQIADKEFSVDIFDVEGVTALCRRERVDGVMTVANEAVFPAYVDICKQMGYPCYLTEKTADLFANKSSFKRLLRESGLPVVPEYALSVPPKKEELLSLRYPVMVKPSDGNASRGVSTCYKPEDLMPSIQRAAEQAKNGRVLVERCMQCDDVIINYVFRDGDYRLCQLGDRIVNHYYKNAGTVTNALIYPSVHLEEYLRTTDPLMREMFRKASVRDGVMFIQAFYEDGKFYCYDPGYRTCGAQVYIMQKAACDFPEMEMLIRHALTGSMGPAEWMDRVDPTFHGKVGCNHAVLLKKGEIGHIDGVDEVRRHPGVVNLTQFVHVGDQILEEGTLGETFARLHYLCDSREELRRVLEFVRNTLSVRSADGEDMLIPDFDLGLL